MQTRDSFDDYGGLTEVSATHEVPHAASTDSVSPDTQNHITTAAQVMSAAVTSAPGIAPPVTKRVLDGTSEDTQVAPSVVAPAPRAQQDEDDSGVREPAVPRGTFASEVPDRAAEGDERESVKVSPSSAPPRQTVRTASSTTSQRLKSVRAPVRPPYLASEILREDLTPSEPGRRHINVVLHAAPALGALAVLSSGIDRVATWISLAVLAALFTVTRFELSYNTLATLVAAIGGSALLAVSGYRVALGGGIDGPLLAASATLLPAALLFRTWYRAAYTARVLVTLALVLAVTWATWTSHRGLLALEFDWQSWVPALTWYLFGILCLLSLLAFMGGETTGGCDVWALGVTVWFGLFACGRFALEERGVRIPNFQTFGLLEPALAAPTSVALAQLFSRVFGTQKMKS